jgi:hypothetical protein
MAPQWERILDYLLAGNSITPVEALNKFGCFRLSERIREIQGLGYWVDRERVKTTGGALVMEYHISELTKDIMKNNLK